MKRLQRTLATGLIFFNLLISLPSILNAQKPGAYYWGDSDNALIDGPDLATLKNALAGLDPGYWLIPPHSRPRTSRWQDLDGNGIADGPDLGIIKTWLTGNYSDLTGNPASIQIENTNPTVDAGDSVLIRARGPSWNPGKYRPGYGIVYEIRNDLSTCAGASIYGRNVLDGSTYAYSTTKAYEYTAEPGDGGWASDDINPGRSLRVLAPGTCANDSEIVVEVYIPADSEFGVNNQRHPARLTAPLNISIKITGGADLYVTAIEVQPDNPTIDEGDTIPFTATCTLSDAATIDCTQSYNGVDVIWSSTGDLTQLNPPNLFQGNQYGGTGTVSAVFDDGVNPRVSDSSPVTVLDIFAPDTFIISQPPDPSSDPDATFEFTCSEPSCIYDCRLDSGGWSACSSPKNYPGLSDGLHLFQVRGIDGGGNPDLSPAGYSWTIEAVPPDTFLTFYPANFTSQNYALFEFVCSEPGCAYQCRIDSGGWSFCVSPAIYNVFWTAISTINAPPARYRHPAVWTGTEMIIWGGDPITNTGGRYHPATDSWAPTSTINAPTARHSHTMVWTASLVIVWGGSDALLYNSGGKYNPATDSWTDTSFTNAPSARASHSAVWAGTEMIVWGGSDPVFLASGGRYNPISDSWTATSITNAPGARSSHTAVWTETEMIVWGGYNGSNYLNTGSRYNPSLNSWTQTSTANAPSGRIYHTALWAGTGMIVWGGFNGIGGYRSGARYNPSSNSWTPTASTNAPDQRYYHSAVWTGTEMIIWGGCFNDGSWKYDVNTGGRYKPSTNSWTETESAGAPSERERQSAIWTGSEMIIWGGTVIGPVNTGAKYYPYGLKFNPTEGTHQFEVRATDPAGKTDPSPALHNWTIDRTPPDTSITSRPSNPSGQASATFTFSSPEAGSDFECKLDTAAYESCASPKTYPSLSQGSHTFSVRARDRAGNTDATPASSTWTIDLTPPETTIYWHPHNPEKVSFAQFRFKCNEGSCTFECKLDEQAWTACSGTVQYSSLAEAGHTFQVRAKDSANNVDPTPAAYSWTIDSIAPNTIINLTPPNPSDTRSATFGFSADEANCAFDCRMDQGQWAICASPVNFTGLNPGAHTFEVRAMDSAGNLDDSPAGYAWTITLADPHSFIIAHPRNPTTDRDAVFEFDCAAGPCAFECKLDSEGWTNCASPVSYSGLALGAHTFAVRATDGIGQLESEPSQFPWEIINYLQVAAGYDHTCALAGNGTLWCWGNNDYDEIDPEQADLLDAPVQVGTDTTWAQVSSGGNHTCALKTNRTLYCWGSNGQGRLGNGYSGDSNLSPQVGWESDWAKISAGADNTCALKTNGAIFCWGNNDYGQLGDGTTSDKNIPAQITTALDWKEISAGNYHTCALKNNGSAWCWGYNYNGQLGDGTHLDKKVPTRVGSDYDWSTASAGYTYTCATKTNRSLWCWGSNADGKLGSGATAEVSVPARIGADADWAKIKASWLHTCGIKTNNELFCWGENEDGQLGDGTQVDKFYPGRIGTDSDWSQVTLGSYHSCAVKVNGEIYCWGGNYYAQLGLGFNGKIKNYPIPEATGSEDWEKVESGANNYQGHRAHVCAKKFAGTLFCWGHNYQGELGIGNTLKQQMPIPVGTDLNWTDLAGGGNHSCALKNDASLFCWGDNSYGQLGDETYLGKASPVQIGAGITWTQITAGSDHTCARKSNGTLFCWGDNASGQLGDGSTAPNRNLPVQVGTGNDWQEVNAGGYHTCGLKNDASAWCWGENGSGQLGIGNTADKNVPARVGLENNWGKISAGANHTCALKTNGSLWCWGENGSGQLGIGSSGADQKTPTRLGADTDWAQVSAGGAHTCGLKSEQSLWCWGSNFEGALGDGTYASKNLPTRIGTDLNWQQLSAAGDQTCALKTGHTLFCWGLNLYGQVGDATAWKQTPQKVNVR